MQTAGVCKHLMFWQKQSFDWLPVSPMVVSVTKGSKGAVVFCLENKWHVTFFCSFASKICAGLTDQSLLTKLCIESHRSGGWQMTKWRRVQVQALVPDSAT